MDETMNQGQAGGPAEDKNPWPFPGRFPNRPGFLVGTGGVGSRPYMFGMLL